MPGPDGGGGPAGGQRARSAPATPGWRGTRRVGDIRKALSAPAITDADRSLPGPGQVRTTGSPSAGSPSTRACAGWAAAPRAGAVARESEDSVLRVERTETAVPDGAPLTWSPTRRPAATEPRLRAVPSPRPPRRGRPHAVLARCRDHPAGARGRPTGQSWSPPPIRSLSSAVAVSAVPRASSSATRARPPHRQPGDPSPPGRRALHRTSRPAAGARPRRARHGGARELRLQADRTQPPCRRRPRRTSSRPSRPRPAGGSAGTGSTAELFVAVSVKEAMSLPARSWSATSSSPGVGSV